MGIPAAMTTGRLRESPPAAWLRRSGLKLGIGLPVAVFLLGFWGAEENYDLTREAVERGWLRAILDHLASGLLRMGVLAFMVGLMLLGYGIIYVALLAIGGGVGAGASIADAGRRKWTTSWSETTVGRGGAQVGRVAKRGFDVVKKVLMAVFGVFAALVLFMMPGSIVTSILSAAGVGPLAMLAVPIVGLAIWVPVLILAGRRKGASGQTDDA